jgi:indole-3-glycerol phosphate synthase
MRGNFMQQSLSDILSTIINRKKEIVEKRKSRLDQSRLEERISQRPPLLRSFKSKLEADVGQGGIAVIAELKKASPSKGILREMYDPKLLATHYEQHGATCLSVLTDEDYFLGSDYDLKIARASCQLPVLRKDFIIDKYQIYESRFLGADCILLIVAALTEDQLKAFFNLANELELDVIIEVSNEEETAVALELGASLLGINNRNLHNFTTDLQNTIRLKKMIPEDKIVICESGIAQREEVEFMLEQGIFTFLIGEALVRAKHPGLKLAELLGRKEPKLSMNSAE